MSPEQVMALADENSPVYMASAFHLTASVYMDEPKIAEAFRTGEGVGWHEHSTCLFCGVEQFFRTGYRAFLVQEWLPALDGVVERLEAGAKVADRSEEHKSELQSLMRIPYAVFCLKKT